MAMNRSEDDTAASIIWTFATRGGQLRLHLANAKRSALPDLHADLRGCALIADTSEEFIRLAAPLIADSGAVLADVLSGPSTHKPLAASIRSVAEMHDPIRAARHLVDALLAATDNEREAFLDDPAFTAERRYTQSLIHSLDEYRGETVQAIATVLRVPEESILQLGR